MCYAQWWVERDEAISKGRQRIFHEGCELAGRMKLRDVWRRQARQRGVESPCLGPVDIIEEPPLSAVRVSADTGPARE